MLKSCCTEGDLNNRMPVIWIVDGEAFSGRRVFWIRLDEDSDDEDTNDLNDHSANSSDEWITDDSDFESSTD